MSHLAAAEEKVTEITTKYDETTVELEEYVEHSDDLGTRLKRVSTELRALKKASAPAPVQAAGLPESSKESYEKKSITGF